MLLGKYREPPKFSRLTYAYVNDARTHGLRKKYGFPMRSSPDNQVDAGPVIQRLFGKTLRSTDVSGAYSATFIATPPFRIKDVLARVDRVDFAVKSVRSGRLSEPMLVKVTTIAEGRREAKLMRYVMESKAVAVPCLRAKFTAKSHVPQLFLAGRVGNAYVQCMRVVERAVPWVRVSAARKRALSGQYERAILGLWALGIVHSDAHDNNVLVDARGRVFVIDFGFATVLPRVLRAKLLAGMCHPNTALDHENIRNYIAAVQMRFGRSTMHSNVAGIRRAVHSNAIRRPTPRTSPTSPTAVLASRVFRSPPESRRSPFNSS